MKKTEKALIRTLVYAAIFNSALTISELWRFLIGEASSYRTFLQALKRLIQQKKIEVYYGLYVLSGNYQDVLLKKRRSRQSIPKMRIAQKYADILGMFPWVWYVGVSGALAIDNAPANDDIDFFIISAPGMLWQTRLLCIVLISLFGKRRKPTTQNVRNKICLNMFMDAGFLALPKNERDLYSAHEVAQLKTLVNKRRTYELFLNGNNWVLKYLPNVFHTTGVMDKLESKKPTGLENVARKLQIKFMRPRITSEVITAHLIRFHPQDVRGEVLSKYTQGLAEQHIRK